MPKDQKPTGPSKPAESSKPQSTESKPRVQVNIPTSKKATGMFTEIDKNDKKND